MISLVCSLLLFFTYFNKNYLYHDIPYAEQNTEQIEPFINQTYRYLGEGSQMYAFVSEDGAYVLKLFKARHKKHFKLSRFLHELLRSSDEWKASQLRWKKKFSDTCRRYTIAFTLLKEETGLIFIHFNKTKKALLTTLVHESPHQIDLSNYPFIIQKKALLVPEYFKKNPQKRLEGKKALQNLFIQRIEKGFNDPRQSLSINYGFINDKAIQIDVGKIEAFEGDKKKELEKIFLHIDEWMLYHLCP